MAHEKLSFNCARALKVAVTNNVVRHTITSADMPNLPFSQIYPLPGFYEPFSVVSHLAGAMVFVVLGGRLLRRGKGDPLRLAVLGVYAASCVLLFAASGIYHMIPIGDAARAVMARIDHGAIFLLIAGTYTPVHGILFRGWSRWLPIMLIWAAAIAGIALKSIYFEDMSGLLGVLLYLLLGWLGALTGIVLALRYGFAFVEPVLWGGIAYSIGALLEVARWPIVIPGVVHQHEMFHIAVLIGAFFHWSFVWKIAAWPTQTAISDCAESNFGSSRPRDQPSTSLRR
jgi:channel protein (hemolysin III family)